MPTFLVSYDAHKVRDYSRFYKAAKELDGVPLLDSMWAFELTDDVSTVRDWAHGLFDADDSIVVIQLKPRVTWATWAAKKAAEWLQGHI